MNEQAYKPASWLRLVMVLVAVIAASIVLLWRGVDLHVFNKQFLQGQGDARALRVTPVAAHRGMILDRNGEPLAISTPVDSVWVQPELFQPTNAQLRDLGKLLELPARQMRETVEARRDKEFAYIKRRINPALAQKVMDLEIPGISLLREYRRYYPSGEVAAHVIGFTNVDDQGQEGLELAYDQWLKGEPGKQRVMKDRLGRVIKHIELLDKPKPGNDLVLSLDRRLQYLAYRELKRAVFQHKAKSGSAVVLDVHTGEVLAMVNQPSFNPNNREQFTGARYRNRAVTDTFEPGSTIKPFTIMAALESGRYKPGTMIDTTPGFYKVGRNIVRDIHNYGRLDLASIIKKSSNVGASKVALSIEPRFLASVHQRIGFGMTTGSGFPGEAGGQLRSATEMREIERATLAFGYGLSTTTLQLARAYTALASDGVLRPVTFQYQTRTVEGRQVFDAHRVRQVRKMLRSVVSDDGTGSRAQINAYHAAGKTGTVKKVTEQGYSDDRYVALFVGMAPATRPELVMAVAIHEPRAEHYYGGRVAAPVFSEVMAGALRLLDIPPDNLNSNMNVAFSEVSP